MARYKTLDYIVRNICALKGDTQAEGYADVMRVAIQVLEEIYLLGVQVVRSEWLTIGDNLTVTLPQDLILVTKVGNLDSNGNLYLMGRDDRIRRVAQFDQLNEVNCNDPETINNIPLPVVTGADVTAPAFVFFNVNRNGENIGEAYGRRNLQHLSGTWRYNRELNVLELGTGYNLYPGEQVLVEYKSTMGDGVHSLIPLEWETAIQYRVFQHQTAYRDPAASERHHRQFVREFSKTKRILQNMTLDQWQSAIEEAQMGAPKW